MRIPSALLAALLALAATVAPATLVAAASPPSGKLLLSGAAAAAFELPADMQRVSSWHDSGFNLDYVRYQQYAAPLGTYVDGAQLTVVRSGVRQVLVIGNHYAGLRVVQVPALDARAALALAASERGGLNELPQALVPLATRRAQLRLDPVSGRLFYLVVTGAPGASRYQQIDAQDGTLLAAWSGIDQVSPGQGVGVKGDTKTLAPGTFAGAGDLVSGTYQLVSADGKFKTYNANGSSGSYPSTPMTDTDNIWNATAQAAAVDAQYYAALTVAFYQQEFSWDWFANCSGLYGNAVRSVVHFSTSYDNAFWDEQLYYMVYGDGSSVDRPLSAGQDVVSHELTHGVTQCRANLNYQDQPGALNEAFSDIMATSAEWTMEEPLSSNCRLAPGQSECADWLIGEDLAKTASGAAIRDFADPGAEGQPSHYEDRVFIGTSVDNGGVHYNSGIVNHAFYLLVNGGRNARCSGPTDPQADCDVYVPPISLSHAEHIFFGGFGTLPANADMCDARNATVAAAGVLYPGSIADQVAIDLAWQAVGRSAQDCDPSADFSISLPDRAIELGPNHSGQLLLDLTRGTELGEVAFGVAIDGPASVGVDPTVNPPEGGSQITVDTNSDAAGGAYPILVSATAGAVTHYAAATLIIDATSPSAAVTGVRFVGGGTVGTNGNIPLQVSWSAADAESGLASAELDHSPNNSSWSTIYGPGTPSSPTLFSTGAGSHYFRVVATDVVGNSTTSASPVRTLTGYQETAPTYTYRGSWSTFTSANPWGTTKFSKRRRASATLAFNGSAVVWVAQRGPKRGVAKVVVDGVAVHVDLYASVLSERRVVFVAANLAAGPHTIKIVVRGTSGRPRVDVDGFYVLSQ